MEFSNDLIGKEIVLKATSQKGWINELKEDKLVISVYDDYRGSFSVNQDEIEIKGEVPEGFHAVDIVKQSGQTSCSFRMTDKEMDLMKSAQLKGENMEETLSRALVLGLNLAIEKTRS